jgi:glycosyltransferase involved in cell wall biosynthesis
VRILGFGTFDLTKHPRIGIVFDGLRSSGDEVVVANVPLGFSTAERVEMLQRPWLILRLVRRMLRSWWTIAASARRARAGGEIDAVMVGYMGHFDVLLARVLFRHQPVVLDLLIFAGDTARDRGVTSRPKLWLLDRLDRIAVSVSDIVLVDTDENAALVPSPHRHKVIVVPVGAPASWFAEQVDDDRRADPTAALRVVFFGLFTPLQGAAVIGAALGLLGDDPHIHTTMIGNGQDAPAARAAASRNPHVTWLDWVDSTRLPEMVADHDVCLGIFGTTPKGMRVVPNKVFQGAAAGCVIVTSDTPPQRRLLEDSAVFVPAGDPGALADVLRGLSERRGEVAALRAAARRHVAERCTPPILVAPIRERLSGRS